MDCHLLRQKVRQKISVIKTNTFDDIKKIHFGILIHSFVLKTTKTQGFDMITNFKK